MKRKPKNHRGLCLAAFHCTHPGIDAHDRLLLSYLAQNADRGPVPLAHPGNKNIADAIGLKDRATDNRLTNNRNRGLIERTSRADGRGKASTYRICWESDFYPDQTPSGEYLIEEEEPRTLLCADSVDGQKEPRTLPCADSEETAHPDTDNRAPQNAKPRIEDPETAHHRVPAALPPPNPHHHLHHHQERAEEVLEEKHMAAIGPWGNKKSEFKALIETHGGEAVDRALTEGKAEGGLDTAHSRPAVMLTRVKRLLAAHAEASAKAEADQRQQIIQNASIERQTAELIALRDRRKSEDEGWSVQDLMNEI